MGANNVTGSPLYDVYSAVKQNHKIVLLISAARQRTFAPRFQLFYPSGSCRHLPDTLPGPMLEPKFHISFVLPLQDVSLTSSYTTTYP